VSAVIEDITGNELLQNQLTALAQLAQHSNPQMRSDTAHFLTLSEHEAALAELEALLQDTEPAVREVARDCLEELQEQLEN